MISSLIGRTIDTFLRSGGLGETVCSVVYTVLTKTKFIENRHKSVKYVDFSCSELFLALISVSIYNLESKHFKWHLLATADWVVCNCCEPVFMSLKITSRW